MKAVVMGDYERAEAEGGARGSAWETAPIETEWMAAGGMKAAGPANVITPVASGSSICRAMERKAQAGQAAWTIVSAAEAMLTEQQAVSA